jgi:hypothetical protein
MKKATTKKTVKLAALKGTDKAMVDKLFAIKDLRKERDALKGIKGKEKQYAELKGKCRLYDRITSSDKKFADYAIAKIKANGIGSLWGYGKDKDKVNTLAVSFKIR